MTLGDFERVANELIRVKEENQELKKQLENYKKLGFKYLQDKNNELEKQQKEFMNYLKDIINWEPVVIEKILQKYKEIIGVSDEKKRI